MGTHKCFSGRKTYLVLQEPEEKRTMKAKTHEPKSSSYKFGESSAISRDTIRRWRAIKVWYFFGRVVGF